MRFSCDKNAMNDAISVCIHAVATKSSISALEGLFLSAENGFLTINGYNFKTGIKRSVEAQIEEEGKCVINARILADITRKLEDDIIEVSVDEKLIATIRCGSAEFNIIASSSEEFPELPSVDRARGITLSCGTLREMITDTVFAISDNENKPIHTGSLFEIEGSRLTMVSVDGYRLAIRKEPVISHGEESFRFVVPGDTLKELARILPDGDDVISIYPERKHALFDFKNTIVTSRLLEGEFLNYRMAVPEDLNLQLTIDRSSLISAVERVSLIISERLKNPIRCVFKGSSVKLSCITARGRAFDECPIPFVENEIEIGFNNRYLLDALKACPEGDFVMCLKSGLSPCVMKPTEGDSFLYLVLPVRLKAEE